MVNTLFLPELREMLAENNAFELQEFCTALHPARTAEFMEGLDAPIRGASCSTPTSSSAKQIFGYLSRDKQLEIIESQDRAEVAELLADLPADDRVDLLRDVHPEVVEELLPLLPAHERREILRLREYPEDTAGGDDDHGSGHDRRGADRPPGDRRADPRGRAPGDDLLHLRRRSRSAPPRRRHGPASCSPRSRSRS